jgi:hypothetical protein
VRSTSGRLRSSAITISIAALRFSSVFNGIRESRRQRLAATPLPQRASLPGSSTAQRMCSASSGGDHCTRTATICACRSTRDMRSCSRWPASPSPIGRPGVPEADLLDAAVAAWA